MRKISLLTFLVLALVLSATATASATDRYAAPTADPSADANVCAPEHPCSIEVAMDPSKVSAGSSVRLASGIYTVSTPLSATDVGLRGQAPAPDVVINTSSTLTFDSSGEGERFTLNSSSSSPAMNVISGTVDHVAVSNSGGHACSGNHATLINVICRSTSSTASAAGFQASASQSMSFSFMNSTFVGGPSGPGVDLLASGSGETLSVELMSTIMYGGSTSALAATSGADLAENIEFSNFPSLDLTDFGGSSTLSPIGTNVGAAPLFTDEAAGNYTQAPGSPTINKGTVNGRSGSTDLVGNDRVIGGAADIGAYESSAIPIVIPPPGGGTTNPPAADTTRPTLTISKKPKSKITSRKIKVVFSANESATFACKLDKGKWKACTSPYKATVKPGKHKLQIQATDLAKNVSAIGTVKFNLPK